MLGSSTTNSAGGSAMPTPREVEIGKAFLTNLSLMVGRVVAETEEAAHGESDPAVPTLVGELMAMVPDDPQQARALFFVLLGVAAPAAVATVNQFCGDPG